MPSREVRVAIIGDPSSLQRALSTADRGVSSFGSRMQSVGSRLRSVGSSMTRNLTLPLVGFGIIAARELSAGERAMAQTEAVIESTGGAAGKTADEIKKLSDVLSELTSLDDEPIQEAANTLLTFQRIAGQTFTAATAATLDLSVAMDKDLRSSAVMVGKALNDPMRGLTALTRVGVTFNNEQREMIQLLSYFGDTAGAQQVILEELNAEFGGSAEALGETATGRLNRFKNKMEDLGASILEDALPALEDFAGVLEDISGAYDELTPKQQEFVSYALIGALALGPLTSLFGGLSSVVGVATAALGALGAALGISTGMAGLLVVAVIGVALALLWVQQNWDLVSSAVRSAVSNIVGNIPGAREAVNGLARAVIWVRDSLSNASDWARRTAERITALFNEIDAGPLTGSIQAIGSALSTIFRIASDVLGILSGIANMDFGGVLGGLGNIAGFGGSVAESSSFIPRRRAPTGGISLGTPSAAEIGREVARHLSITPQPVYDAGAA